LLICLLTTPPQLKYVATLRCDLSLMACYNTIQYNIRLLEAVRTQRRTIIEREKYVENENVKMVHNE